jgi:hypothetical protein
MWPPAYQVLAGGGLQAALLQPLPVVIPAHGPLEVGVYIWNQTPLLLPLQKKNNNNFPSPGRTDINSSCILFDLLFQPCT